MGLAFKFVIFAPVRLSWQSLFPLVFFLLFAVDSFLSFQRARRGDCVGAGKQVGLSCGELAWESLVVIH